MSQHFSDRIQDIRSGMTVRNHTVLLVVSTLAINILSLGLPVLTLQVYDRILPNPESGTLQILITGMCMVVALEIVLRLARTYMMSWAGASFEYEAMSQAIRNILNADLTVVSNAGIGENLNRISSISRLKDFYNGYVLVTLIDIAFAGLFMGLIAYIGGWLVLVPVTVMTLFLASSVYYGRQLYQGLKARDRADDRRYNFMIGVLEGIHSLKAMALEGHFIRRYEWFEKRSTVSNYQVTQAAASSFNAASVYSHMMIAGTIATGAYLSLHGHMASGALIACILLSGRLMQPVQRGLGLWARYQDFKVARHKADQVLGLPQVRWKNMPKADPMVGEGLATLSLRDVGFYIHSSNKWLFNNVNLHMKPGMAIHISGVHGVGRSVLMNMIAGVYKPSCGDIIIDGFSIQDYSREEFPRKVGLINSESEIFRGTIMDNLTRFGLTDFEEIRDIVVALGIERDVNKLSMGYDTFLQGVEPDSVTPGLKQRIGIARVLALRPKIVLFDDGDRNLDRNGYKNIISTLGYLRPDVCMILVTDDRYIERLAHFHYQMTSGGLSPIHPPEPRKMETLHAA